MPFRGDDGIFEEDFIEDRRKGLEVFVNKYVPAIVTLTKPKYFII
jgi:hypothetical protein